MNRDSAPMPPGWGRRMTRRGLLRGGAGLGLGLGAAYLAACGGGGEKSTSSSSSSASPGAGLPRAAATPGVQIAATAAAPKSTVKYGGSIKAVWETEPTGTFDPARTAPGFVSPQRFLVFNGFYRREWPDLSKWIPELVTSREQPERGTFVFKLKPGVKLHDESEEVNADLVKWNVERHTRAGFDQDGGFKGSAKGMTAEVIDPLTVRFKFDPPQVSNIEVFLAHGSGYSTIVSRKADERLKENFWKEPVGTGPFKFVEWKSGSSIKLKKWEQYFEKDGAGNATPYIDEVNLLNLPDASVRLLSIQSGEVDHTKIEPRDVPTLKTDPNVEVQLGGAERLVFWLNHTAPPFNNQHIRLALSYAVDRKAIADALFFGTARPGGGMPEGSPWFDPKFQQTGYDPARVQQELAAANMPDGFKFACAVLPTGVRRQTMELMQAQLKKQKIEMEILPMESSDYVDRLFNRRPPQLDAFFALTGGVGTGEASGMEGYRAGPVACHVDYPKLIELYDKVLNTWEIEPRKKLIGELQEIFYKEVAFQPVILDSPRPFAVRKKWAGASFLPSDGNYPDWRYIRQA